MDITQKLLDLNNVTGYAHLIKDPIAGLNGAEQFLHVYGTIIMFAIMEVTMEQWGTLFLLKVTYSKDLCHYVSCCIITSPIGAGATQKSFLQ